MRTRDAGTAILDAAPSAVDDVVRDVPEPARVPRRSVRVAAKGVDPDVGYRSPRAIERVVAGTPWEEADLARVARACSVGAVALAVAWFAADRAEEWSRQMLWIAVAIGAVAYTAVGIGRWLLSGLGVVRMVRRGVVRDFQLLASPPEAAATVGDHEQRVVAAGMQRAHRPSCPFVALKDVEVVGLREIRARGLRSCEVCAS